MSDLDNFLEHFGVVGMKWGHRKSDFTTTSSIISNVAPKVGSTTLDSSGKLALVIRVKSGGKEDSAGAEKLLGRPLGSNEKVYHVTTQTHDQFLAQKEFNKKKRNFNIARDAVQNAYQIGSFVAQEDKATKDFLEHFGVVGMKWGIRRSRSSKAVSAPSPKSQDFAKASEVAKRVRVHGTSSASNQELDDLIKRMKLEKQFRELVPKKQSKKSVAGKFISDIMLSVAKTQVTNLANDALGAQVGKFLKKEAPLEIGKHSSNYGRHLKR